MRLTRRQSNAPRAGFTIVEFLVYITILMLVMASSVTFLFSINGVITQYRLETELYRGGTAVLEQVVLALRQAEEFNAGGSTLHPSTSGVLSVTGDSTTEFARIGSQLMLSVDGVAYGDITSDVLFVDGFTVYRYDTTNGEFVRVELDLRASIGEQSRSATFYGGAVLRGAF